jgi:hypothetical protein
MDVLVGVLALGAMLDLALPLEDKERWALTPKQKALQG